ncbi:MAG: PspC domain protein [Myxococcales bacterium]|nr:PspC domain protein [Myxococcales bacterium]
MTMHDCTAFQDRLTSSLLDNVPPPADAMASARECSTCTSMLRDLVQAIDPEDGLAPSSQVSDRAIARGRRRARRAYAIAKVINVSISVTLVTLWFVYVELGYRSMGGFRFPEAGQQARAIVVASTVLVFGYLALRGWGRAGERSKLYSRWAGRQLQGICNGIARFFGAPVWLIRVGFLALFVAGLGGGTIYFLLAFLVDWHPDDRKYMTWFRIERWWLRRRGNPHIHQMP